MHLGENDLPNSIKRTSVEYLSISNWAQALVQTDKQPATAVTVASDLIRLLIHLLQPTRGVYSNERLSRALRSAILPVLEYWLQKKITLCTQPDQLVKLMELFQETLWPDKPQATPVYDISKLRALAAQVIRSELPVPVLTILGKDINSVIFEVLDITANKDLNRQLLYSVIDHLLLNSCLVLSQSN